MAASMEFSAVAVREVLLKNGGKLTNTELARHFKKYLLDPENGEKNQKLFKEFVSQVAVIRRTGTSKFIMLEMTAENMRDLRRWKELADADHSSSSSGHQETSKEIEYLETNDQSVMAPVAPPRRKHSEKENKPTSNTTATSDPESSPNEKTEGDAKESTPIISVKDQAHKLNKIVSESQVNLLLNSNKTNVKKFPRNKQHADDDDTVSVISLDVNAKEWIVKAAQADYHALLKLLKDQPRLAKYKDFTSGYTALHWAAKHGNKDVVKLIAGTHRVDVNIRSHGGYTPLHLAAMFKRREVYELLLNGYKANPTLRDYNGLLAEDHWPEKRQQRTGSTGSGSSKSGHGERHPSSRRNSRRHSEKEAGFLRLGSFNAKVRKTAESLGGSHRTVKPAKLHKGWGSADNLPQKSDKHLMPPPNTVPSNSLHKTQKSSRKSHLPTSKSDIFH